MSSKPNAEANELDYAKAPLTFNSVETIPELNASPTYRFLQPLRDKPYLK